MTLSVTILAINDDDDILEIYRQFLTRRGYTLKFYTDAEQALAEVGQIKPALIILDWLLGDVGRGYRVLQRLRAHPVTATTPVIICTVMVNNVGRIEQECAALGVRVLYKPFPLADLLTEIRALLPQS